MLSDKTPAFALLALSGLVAFTAQGALIPDNSGKMHFDLHQTPAFDTYTNDTRNTAFWNWLKQHVWRAMEYTTYFDRRNALFPNAWVYDDAYAIYNNGTGWARSNPEWILRTGPSPDSSKVFIDYACGGGSCPQYAADVSNAAFRAAWITRAQAWLAHGYKGLWIDDVNLIFRFSDGTGSAVPWDVNTNAQMTQSDWANYMVQFMVQIRAQIPATEIVHNSIWFGGGTDIFSRDLNPFVALEQATADFINLERGVNDPGLTGGNGYWSYRELLTFIDRAHLAGAGVLLDDYGDTESRWQYTLASYFLVSTGRDAAGVAGINPGNWWKGFDTDLGYDLGPRYTDSSGLLRRDFTGGLALVNPPDGVTRAITLSKPYGLIDGGTVTSIELNSGEGIVLLNADFLP